MKTFWYWLTQVVLENGRSMSVGALLSSGKFDIAEFQINCMCDTLPAWYVMKAHTFIEGHAYSTATMLYVILKVSQWSHF